MRRYQTRKYTRRIQNLKRIREESGQEMFPVKRFRYVQNIAPEDDPHVLELEEGSRFQFESDLTGEPFTIEIISLDGNVLRVRPLLTDEESDFFFTVTGMEYHGKLYDGRYPQYKVKAFISKIRRTNEYIMIIDDVGYSGFRVREFLPPGLAELTTSFLGGGDIENLADVRNDIEQYLSDDPNLSDSEMNLLFFLEDMTKQNWPNDERLDKNMIRLLRQMMKDERKETNSLKMDFRRLIPYLFKIDEKKWPLVAYPRDVFDVDPILKLWEEQPFEYLRHPMAYANNITNYGDGETKLDRPSAGKIRRDIDRFIKDNNINPKNDPIPFEDGFFETMRILRRTNDDDYHITISP